MSRRQDYLILFLGFPEGPYPTDQIRVMKGLFLFSQEGPAEAHDLYEFVPYDFGPFDTGVYRDLDEIRDQGLLTIVESSSTSQCIYGLTPAGRTRYADLEERTSLHITDQLGEIKTLVTSLSFTNLLRHVYAKYPESAKNTVARGVSDIVTRA